MLIALKGGWWGRVYYHVRYISSNMSYVWFSFTASIDQYASIGFVWNLCISWQVELSLPLCEGGAATRLNISRWDLYSTCWGSWTNIWSWNMKTEWAAVCFKDSAELLKSVLDHCVRGDWNQLHILYAKIKSHWLLWQITVLLSCTKVFSRLTRSSLWYLTNTNLSQSYDYTVRN